MIRIEPLGSDSKGNIYWHFSFMNKIIVEKKLENLSVWYSVTQSQFKQLIQTMKSCKEKESFIKTLNEKLDLINDEKEIESVSDESLKDEETEPVEDPDEIKSKLSKFEKRPVRSFYKIDESNNGSNSECETEVGVKSNKKTINQAQLENYLASFKDCHSADDLILVNMFKNNIN